jgi:hypothetical protein
MSPLYQEVDINELAPGPRRASSTGRVANMFDQNIEGKMPKDANGYLKLLVKNALSMIVVGREIPPPAQRIELAFYTVMGADKNLSITLVRSTLTPLRLNSGIMYPM